MQNKTYNVIFPSYTDIKMQMLSQVQSAIGPHYIKA